MIYRDLSYYITEDRFFLLTMIRLSWISFINAYVRANSSDPKEDAREFNKMSFCSDSSSVSPLLHSLIVICSQHDLDTRWNSDTK